MKTTKNDRKRPCLWYLDNDSASNKTLLKQLLDLIHRDMPMYQHRLFSAVANNDRTLFNQTAHTLRSSLYLLGLYDEAGALQEMEQEITEFRPDTAQRMTTLMNRINQGIGVLTLEAGKKRKEYTILIADDESLALTVLSYRMQKEGYQVQTATDGRQALDKLRNGIPDLVITDLMMPYHSGLEVLEYVRKSDSPQVPVIVLSAASQEHTVLKAFSLGADDFAVKPFSLNELASRVRRHLINA